MPDDVLAFDAAKTPGFAAARRTAARALLAERARGRCSVDPVEESMRAARQAFAKPTSIAAHFRAVTPCGGAELRAAAKPKPDRCPTCKAFRGCAQGTCTDPWHAAKEGAR